MKITPIRIRRMNAGLDSNAAVEALGISQSTFYKLEQGWTNPGIQLIVRLAKVYKCTTDEIFNDLNIIGLDNEEKINMLVNEIQESHISRNLLAQNDNIEDVGANLNPLSPVERQRLEARIKELEIEIEIYKSKIKNAKMALNL
ncbi:DNA-binding XRE family transcriptional regulator [Clostridium beijerinckii]|uniref:Helix-turn-helix domain-containing protein n=1 Tax=Clostridium beijerinckii TaxID=1520 RepID=A0AAW3W911_CLOBE|nr:helix-turn-helix domain-containing protein [Clostridium beijerinckii]MBC2475356.1 helix-turn-helix domain-containing protein [Clostridium beijerinckii]NOV62574.1 DNA-binding XRE family transcriptional regulator [Clostridium beijerinckii]NOV70465.1 DNA-binding XRE family transcriptional regulator [Clostridium beijerinckii]NOW30626.1 DNA-binding XRE family transcriptional regulator [Clostridium beijerinckii]